MQKIAAELPQVKFNRKDTANFYSTLRKRVNDYFEQRNISKHANAEMISKTVLLISLFLISYGLIISNILSPWLMLVMACFNGFVTALIGLNVAHDAIHGSYTSSKKKNKLLGLSFNIIGANDYMWHLKHNMVHHIVTNIPEHDDDINQIDLIRINPEQKRWKIHRFQHIYMFLLYPLASISWVFMKDYTNFFKMHSKDNLKGKFPTNEMIRLFGYKFLYYTIMLIIPLLVIDLAWYYILLGFVALHLVEGITLTIIFQLAHVVEGTDFPVPDPGGNIENSWAVHQVYTTADFAIDDPVVCYLFGGLNFQIEHHLFPKICHVHYPKIAPIVEQTAKEFGFPYINNKTLGSALKSHIRLMRDFGKGVK